MSLRDLGAMRGHSPETSHAKVTVTAKPEAAAGGGADRQVGEGMSGGLRRRRIEIVKKVMKKHGLSRPTASKYVKEHKQYQILFNLI